MKITETKFDPHSITGPATDADSGLGPRSHGPGILHLSTIYQDLDLTVTPRDNDLSEEELQYYRSVGFIWERVMDEAFARALVLSNTWHTGEVERDGITGSPDLVDATTLPWTVVDTKATWRSAWKSDQLEKFFWSWLVQLRGYCHMLDTHKARLLILHVNGDYKPPRPRVKQLEIEFSAMEIRDNWSMVVNHAIRKGWLKR